MSEKTDAFVPKFYLYQQDQSICITRPMLLGRTMGDVIIDNSTLSAKHCVFIPRLLALYVMDLGSSNGVFVNKQKIFPHEEVKIAAGDEIRIGEIDYVVFDSEEKYKIHLLSQQSLNYKPDRLFQLSDVVTFFHVSMNWRAFYSLAIVGTIVSILFHSKLGIPLGDDLKFLNETYSEFLILYGMRSILVVWGICLLHAFLIKSYFKKHHFYRAMSVAPMLLVFFYSSNIYYGPAGFLKQYVEIRHSIVEPVQETKGINQLKKLTDSQEKLVKNFSKISGKLNQDQQKILMNDQVKLLAQITSQIEKVKK